MLSEDEYVSMAQEELAALIRRIDELDSDDLESELENDIITLEFGDDATYIINSHRAARQIWMAAERKAWHFDWDVEAGAWIAKKTGEELWEMVRQVVGNKLGAASVNTTLVRGS